MSQVESLPRVTLKRRRALPFFSRHPWVFAGAIAHVQGDPPPAAEVALVAHDGTFIARGLFNPASNIRVRLYSWEEGQPLDESFWGARLDEAIALRERLFAGTPAEKACRVVFSEADGLSGLTVDRYGDWLVAQFTSRALAERRALFVKLLCERLQPAGIWLRTEKGIGKAEGLLLEDGLLHGEPPPRPLFITEHGLSFGVDIVEGQKTGFYLDQRDNRRAISRYVGGGRVLDLFCYSGAFGIAAARLGQAKQVIGVDSSVSALQIAEENARLNEVSDRVHFEHGDVGRRLEELGGAGERFDVVVLDPPKMARHRKGIPSALRAYATLNRMAMAVLEEAGILVSCSCSGLLSREDFEATLSSAALDAGRTIQVLESRGQAPDHTYSLHCAENNYLKCLICRVL